MVFDVADRQMLLHQTTAELSAVATGKRGIFVVERGGDLIGYIDVHGVLGEEAAHFASFSLAIRRAWWGCGMGAQLVSAAEAWARSNGYIFLVILVAVRNARAFTLYQRLGYTVCGETKVAHEIKGGLGEHHTMGRMIVSVL